MNILESLYKYTSKPIRDLIELGNITQTGLGVKRVEAPKYTLEELQRFADQGGSEAFRASPRQQQYAQDLGRSQKAYEKVQNYKPLVLYNDEMEGLLDYDRALKNAAIAGSFMMPGIGSGLGGALATGAVAGGMGGYGGSRRGEELGSTLGGATLGGALGGLGYGVRKGIQSLGGGKVNPKFVKGKPSKYGMSPDDFQESAGKLLSDMADEGFDVSNPKKIANNIEPFLKRIGKRTSDYAALADGTPDLSAIEEIWKANKGYLSSGKGSTAKFRDLTEGLLSKSNPTFDDVVQYKMSVDKLGGGFDKVQRANKPLLGQTMKEVRGAARQAVSSNSILDDLLNKYSNALDMKSAILKNPEITSKLGVGGIFPLKFSVNTRPVRDLLRPGGSASQLAGKAMSVPQKLLGKTSAGQLAGIISGPAIQQMQGSEQQPEQQVQPESQGLGMGGQVPFIDPQTGFVSIPELSTTQGQAPTTPETYTIQDGLREALTIMPNASESQILSLAKTLVEQNSQTGGAGKDLNTTQSKYYGVSESAKSASTLLDQMASVQGQELPGFGKTVTSAIADLFNTSDPRMLEYRNKIASIDLAVSNLIAGTNISASEAKRLHKLVPTMGDSVAEAKSKLAELDALGITGAGLSGVQGNSEDSMVNDYELDWVE